MLGRRGCTTFLRYMLIRLFLHTGILIAYFSSSHCTCNRGGVGGVRREGLGESTGCNICLVNSGGKGEIILYRKSERGGKGEGGRREASSRGIIYHFG